MSVKILDLEFFSEEKSKLLDVIFKRVNEEKKTFIITANAEITISKMVSLLNEKYKNLNIVGYNNGYDDDSDDKITNQIKSLKPDYVFVAKGCPLQDEWIIKVISQVDKGVFMGVGGSFDVLSGNVKRAPELWQNLNLEWLYRVLNDPKRIGRYMSLPKFVIEVFKDRRNLND